jgi:hypothetical protein
MHKLNKMSSGKSLVVYACQSSVKYCTQITMNIVSLLINSAEPKLSSFLAHYKPRHDIHIYMYTMFDNALPSKYLFYSFYSNLIWSYFYLIIHYNFMFTPLHWIIPQTSLIQILMLLFCFQNKSYYYFI